MKGIILAGGSGTRLHPLTLSVSKQLLPIFDKPMIYYPLTVLMRAGIKDILVISTPRDLPNFKHLLGDGSAYGIQLTYKEQPTPDGLAQAFIIGESFIGNDDVCLILGDNLFYGAGLDTLLESAVNSVQNDKNAVIFGNYVKDPERYGVAEFDTHNRPSSRGELEITSVNQLYLEQKTLKLELLKRGFAWLDTGTHEALAEATEFVKAIEKRTGRKVGCPEEIALDKGWVTQQMLSRQIRKYKGDYYTYIKSIIA